jgi:hypothetical protein
MTARRLGTSDYAGAVRAAGPSRHQMKRARDSATPPTYSRQPHLDRDHRRGDADEANLCQGVHVSGIAVVRLLLGCDGGRRVGCFEGVKSISGAWKQQQPGEDSFDAPIPAQKIVALGGKQECQAR